MTVRGVGCAPCCAPYHSALHPIPASIGAFAHSCACMLHLSALSGSQLTHTRTNSCVLQRLLPCQPGAMRHASHVLHVLRPALLCTILHSDAAAMHSAPPAAGQPRRLLQRTQLPPARAAGLQRLGHPHLTVYRPCGCVPAHGHPCTPAAHAHGGDHSFLALNVAGTSPASAAYAQSVRTGSGWISGGGGVWPHHKGVPRQGPVFPAATAR